MYKALAKWLIWLEHCLVHQQVAGSILLSGTILGLWVRSSQDAYRRQLIGVSHISFSLSPFLSKISNKCISVQE